MPADSAVDRVTDENDQSDRHQCEREILSRLESPRLSIGGKAPGKRIEGQRQEGDPCDEWTANTATDDVKGDQRYGERHEVVPVKVLFEDKPQAQRGSDE